MALKKRQRKADETALKYFGPVVLPLLIRLLPVFVKVNFSPCLICLVAPSTPAEDHDYGHGQALEVQVCKCSRVCGRISAIRKICLRIACAEKKSGFQAFA
jgi:hypothetical protein